MRQIWNILFTRLQYRSTVKFIKSLIVFASLFGVKHSPGQVIETINLVQPDLFSTILDKIWIPNLVSISGDIETKLCAVFATMLVGPLFQTSKEMYVGRLVNSVMTLLVKPEEERVEDDKDVPDMDEVAGYVAVYAQLHNAAKKEDDPLKDVKDPKEFVAKTLAAVSQQYRSLSTVLQQGMEPSNMAALGQFCSTYGVTLA
jgi:exportin-2 (importin alpha re-exporter)